MQARTLGPGAPLVSAIGLGGMPLSLHGRPPEDTGHDVIHASLEAGVTLIDTADVYCVDDGDIGHNERLIARALSTWSGARDDIVVATKGGLTRPEGRWERNGHPDHLHRACIRSLEALRVDVIDLYQLHAPDPRVPFTESVGALAQLQSEGKIRWIGLSNVTVDEIKAAETIVTVVSVQNRLNPFFREARETGVVDFCGDRGIGFLAYSPVGGGRLNKKLPSHPVLGPIARKLNTTPHNVALAWVLAQGGNVIAIPGSRTISHAVSAAESADVQLDHRDMGAIDASEFPRA